MYKNLFQIILFIAVLEILFRIFGINETFMESYEGTYQYFFVNVQPSWFHTWQPNSTIKFGQDEFTYTNHYNELGHRETPFKDFQSDTSSLKILCLGDSFTEGDGAPYDSSWVRFFEQGLAQKLDTNVKAYNAGVCGSDVVFNGIILQEKLISSKAKVVLECLNNSDITDIYYRGGKDRFAADGSMNSPKVKWWEPIYKYSYVVRAFVCTFSPYDNNLTHQKNLEKDEQLSLEIMANQIIESYNLCRSNNIDYYVIINPVPSDVIYRDFQIFEDLPSLIPKEIPLINLYPRLYSTYDSLNITDYSWKANGHYNGKGYEVLGKSILKEYLQLNAKHQKHAL